MKKSELKEIIRTSLLKEYEEDYERESRKIEFGIDPEKYNDEFPEEPESEENYESSEYWNSILSDPEDIEEAKKDKKEEEEEEETEEEDFSIDDEEDIELTDSEPELEGDGGDIQSNLQAALMAAKQLGDQKLIDQIGNTITFYTRTHIVGSGENVEEIELNEGYNRFKKLAGIIK